VWLGGKSWSGAGGGVVPERLRTVLAGTGEPTADRLFSGPESRGDVALIPALLLQSQPPQPPPLMPVLRHEVRTLHTQFYRPQNLTNSARLSVTRPALWLADGVVVEQLPAVRDDGLRLARPV